MAIVPIIIISFAVIIGLSSALFKEDKPIEDESATFDNQDVDFGLTPDSKELGPIAMMKIREAWICKCDRQMEE